MGSSNTMQYEVKPYDHVGDRSDNVLPVGKPNTIAFVAPRCCGKSNVMLHLIRNIYAKQFHRVFILNPTFYSDNKWVGILNVRGLLAHPVDAETPEPVWTRQSKPKKFDGKLHPTDVITSNFEEALENITTSKKELADPRVKWLIICDDLAASGLLRQDRTFLNALLNGRHTQISLWYSAQTYTSLSRGVRLNTEVWFLFTRVSNKRELRKMYEEHSMGLDETEWLAVYHTVKRSGPYAFLTINYTVHSVGCSMTNSLRNFISVG